MKHIPSSITGTAARERKLFATVGAGDTHLLPADYEKTLERYNDGTLAEVRIWSGGAWKNDHAGSRLDFFVQEDIPQAELVTADLVSASGAVIKKENITATYLAKVDTLSPPYPEFDYECFDIITHKSVGDLAAGQLHEAWVDIYVPKDAEAGTYRTTLTLKSGTKTLAEFTYELEVADMTLTDPEDWETFLDLWSYPYATNRYYSGKTNAEYFGFTTPEDQDTNPSSLCYVRLDKKYEAALESELELFHQAGGNTITATIVEDPWNSRKPCPCPSMVKWTKKKDGTFVYDYTDLDYWIELNMKHGIDRQINLYSLAGVGWGFVFYDEASGTVGIDSGGHPGAERWKQMSRDFLADLIAHLEEKGWFDIACLYMDEREYDWVRAVLEVAESVKNSEGKTLKVGGAVNGKTVAPLYDRLYDIAIWENALPDDIAELSETRRAKGLQTIVYTCGDGKMSIPNEPAEAAYAVYESYKNNTDGILRWALNKYDEDPLHATLHYVTYPGDCYLIYPDEKDSTTMQAQSSPRYEKLCEGMRNVEKLRILRREYPDHADEADSIVAAVGTGSMVDDASEMRTRILSLSRSVISHAQG